jgi:hypothetical protein
MPPIKQWIKSTIEKAPSVFREKDCALAFLNENQNVEKKLELACELLKIVASDCECITTWNLLVAQYLKPTEKAMREILPNHRDHVIHSANLYLLGVAVYLDILKKKDKFIDVIKDRQLKDAQHFFSIGNIEYSCRKSISDIETIKVIDGDYLLVKVLGEGSYIIEKSKEWCPSCGEEESDDESYEILSNRGFWHVTLDNSSVDMLFRRRWGLIAILHDAAYPLELAGKQIKEYMKNVVEDMGCPFSQCPEAFSISINRLCDMTTLPYVQVICDCNINRMMYSNNTFHLIATNISNKLHTEYSAECLASMMLESLQVALSKGSIDHGTFSALLMLRLINNELRRKLEASNNDGSLVYDNPERKISEDYHVSAAEYFYIECVDAASAIYLHNAKRMLKFFQERKLDYEAHPFAWLLLLCDQLQEWERPSGGTADTKERLLPDDDYKINIDDEPTIIIEFPEKTMEIRNEVDGHLTMFGKSFIRGAK